MKSSTECNIHALRVDPQKKKFDQVYVTMPHAKLNSFSNYRKQDILGFTPGLQHYQDNYKDVQLF